MIDIKWKPFWTCIYTDNLIKCVTLTKLLNNINKIDRSNLVPILNGFDRRGIGSNKMCFYESKLKKKSSFITSWILGKIISQKDILIYLYETAIGIGFLFKKFFTIRNKTIDFDIYIFNIVSNAQN